MSSPSIARVSYTHDGMIDLIIARPGISQGEIAAHFGYTPSWVSIIVNSDAFQARLAERKGELVDPLLTVSVEEKMRAVVSRSLEVLAEKLAAPTCQISDTLALRAMEVGSKAMGMGQPVPPPPDNIDGHLQRLADRLLLLQKQVRGEPLTIDITPEGGRNAPQEILVEGRCEGKYPAGDEGRQAAETGRGDCSRDTAQGEKG